MKINEDRSSVNFPNFFSFERDEKVTLKEERKEKENVISFLSFSISERLNTLTHKSKMSFINLHLPSLPFVIFILNIFP